MGTDWFVKVKCPRPKTKVKNSEEHKAACSGCPYAIWDEPEYVAGFMSSMCGVRVGSIGMAASLDDIGKKLSGIERFTKSDGELETKLDILKQIKAHTEEDNWKFEGFTKIETLNHLDLLIDFCSIAKKKGLDILVWA